MKSLAALAFALLAATPLAMVSTAQAPQVAQAPLSLSVVGSFKSGPMRGEDPRIAEINAFDPIGKRIYVVNPQAGRLDVIDASAPAALTPAAPVDIVAACGAALGSACPVLPGSEPNSVAIRGSLMAVAVANAIRTDNGHAVFFTLQGTAPPQFVAAVEAGALPDMVTFTPDGKYALLANEGEPNQAYTIDPPGSVTIVEVAQIGTAQAARRAGFEQFDEPAERAAIEADGVRIFGPGASVAQDLEPEYIAVSGNRAYVTLQENNALAIVNIADATVEKVVGLGLKDHSVPGNFLDPSDQDGSTINIQGWPVHGLYQPDAIAPFTVRGLTYLMLANEGDGREYAAFTEVRRAGNAAYPLDPAVFTNALDLKLPAKLGRLNVSIASGDANHDGLYERIEVFGGRSVSVRDHEGRLVWDSGESLERLSQQHHGTLTIFNTTNTANSLDNRSDDKGIEPESVVVGDVGGRLYAFVGLERDGGIAVYDVSEPTAPEFVTYATNRRLPRDPVTGALLPCTDAPANDCGDLGPEGLTFVPAAQSPTSYALLIVSNEASSTTTVWQVTPATAPNAPTALAVSVAGTTATFTWTAPASGNGPVFYALESGTAPGVTTLPVIATGSPVTTWALTFPPGGYFARVRGGNSAGTSGVSNEVAFGIAGTSQVPGPPIGLVAAVTGTTARFDWTPPAIGGAVSSYRLEAGSRPGATDRGIFSLAGAVTTVSGPAPAGTHYARLRGVNAVGAGPPSNEVQFTVGAAVCTAPPVAPVLLTPTMNGQQVSLTWLAPGNTPVAGYQLRAGNAAGLANLAAIELGAVTSYSVPAPPGTYYVSLVARSACGDSAVSNTVVVVVGATTTLPAPQNFRGEVTGRTVTLAWDPIAGAGSYLLEAGNAPGLSNAAVLPIGGTWYQALNVPPGVYYVRVRAIGAAGAGAASQEVQLAVQ